MTKVFEGVEGNADIHLRVMKAILEETGGMHIVDLMCCEAPQTAILGVGNHTYVDIVPREIKGFEPEKDKFYKEDAVEFMRKTDKRYHAAICLDGIEHLPKAKGLELLSLMEVKSDKQIIFTPIGNYLVEEVETDNPDTHKSGWTPKEFEDYGWATLVFPSYHPTLNAGAFFAFNGRNLASEFSRVCNWCERIDMGLNVPKGTQPKVSDRFVDYSK